jgi:putative transposase
MSEEYKSGNTLLPISESGMYRRKLPHFQEPGSAYFVTFSANKHRLLTPAAKSIVFDCLKFHAGMKYELYACVVMETHVHAVIQPLKEHECYFSLSQIMHSVKSYSAKEINRFTGEKGSVWIEETYDRIVRDEPELLEKLNYIVK